MNEKDDKFLVSRSDLHDIAIVAGAEGAKMAASQFITALETNRVEQRWVCAQIISHLAKRGYCLAEAIKQCPTVAIPLNAQPGFVPDKKWDSLVGATKSLLKFAAGCCSQQEADRWIKHRAQQREAGNGNLAREY